MKNPASIYLSKWPKSSDTYKTMRAALARMLDEGADPELHAWHELAYEDVRAIPAELADEGFAPRTINQSLSALRGVLEAAWRAGMLPDDAYRKMEIDSVAGDGEKAGRALSAAEMDALFAALEKAAPPVSSVIAFLAATGARRVELVRARIGDYVDGRALLRGKGNKRRTVPVGARWRRYIEGWVGMRDAADSAPMFEFENVKHPRRAVSYVVEVFCKQLGLAPFTPHDLRRTFITHVEKIAGPAVAQQLAGHSDPKTTMLYVRVDEAREAAAVKDL